MTLQLLRIIRRAGLEPADVEVVEELPQRLKMRVKSSGIIFYIGKVQNPKCLGTNNH